MPAVVDHEARRAQVASAALAVLAESGFNEVTIRRVAAELGASTSVVTHYFSGRDELLAVATDSFLDLCRLEVDELIDDDPAASLRRVVEWTVHDTDPAARRVWLSVVLGAAQEAVVRAALDTFLEWYDGVIERLVAAADAGGTGRRSPARVADQITIIVNGLVVSGLESPDRWTPDRQRQVLEDLLGSLALGHEEARR